MKKVSTRLIITLAILTALMGVKSNIFAQNPNTFLTQSPSQVPITSVFGCAAWWTYTGDNQFYRIYDLADSNNLSHDSFQVRNVEVGICTTGSLLSTAPHPFTVRIYSISTTNFTSLTSLTLLAEKDTTLAMNMWLQKITIPIEVRVGANDRIVVEADAASGISTFTCIGFGFVTGELEPSYFTAGDCALTAPSMVSNYTTIRPIINVNGEYFSRPDAPTWDRFKDTTCSGATNVVYSVNPAQYAETYQWSYSGGGGTINGNGSPNITMNFSLNATSGNLNVTPYNYYGSGTSISRFIQVDSIFEIGLNVVSPTICLGDNIPLEGPTGYMSYRWEPPTGLSSINTRTTVASPMNSHSYTLVVEDEYGCRGIGSAHVSINTGPHIYINPNPINVCDDSVDVALSGAVSYEWAPTNGIGSPYSSSTKVRPAATTNYVITATDTMGCTSETPTTINVNNIGNITITQNGKILSVPTGYSYLWYKDGIPVVPSAIFNQYNAKEDGVYKVLITDANGCSTFSDEVELKGLGIIDLNTTTVKLYPNPTNDKVYIETPLRISYELYSIDGKMILSEENLKEVDMSGLSSGMYYLTIKDQDTGNKASFKIVKQE